ncbi:MAG: sensor domain-containing protein [Ktedonobacteraceae bacterium]|nr:sensor domain-containing protein [Ktedonobacteraceae bacterium]
MMQSMQTRKHSHTASNMLYLLLSFPLGLIYFILLVVGLSVGLGTVILWIGIPLLLLILAGIQAMAAMERDLAGHLLHVYIPGPLPRTDAQRGFRGWARKTLRDPLTWKGLLYVFIKFPLGIISFCLVVTLLTTAFALVLEPLAYLLNVSIDGLLHSQHVSSNSWMPFVGWFSDVYDPMAMLRSFLGIPAGIVLMFVSLYLLNGLASISGALAQVMLGPGYEQVAHPKDERHAYAEGYPYQEAGHEYAQQRSL